MPTLLGFSALLAHGDFLPLSYRLSYALKKMTVNIIQYMHVMIKSVHYCDSQGKIAEGDT